MHFKNNIHEIMLGDCLEKMKLISSGSVDAIICDPPYGTVNGAELDGWDKSKTKWDTVIDHSDMLEECNRVLRKSGVLILFCQDPYTGKLMTDTHGNLPFSYRLTWLKDHFANPLFAKKAPVNYTEDICVFFKKYDTLVQHPLREYVVKIKNYIGKNRKQIFQEMGHQGACHFLRANTMQFSLCTEKTYLELIELYDIDKISGFMPYSKLKELDSDFKNKFLPTFNLYGFNKFKSNVLNYKKDYQGLHPTQKPVKLMEDIVRTYTNEGDLALDFACGSGSTVVACKNLKRNCIGIELNEEYCRIARNRIKDNQRTL